MPNILFNGQTNDKPTIFQRMAQGWLSTTQLNTLSAKSATPASAGAPQPIPGKPQTTARMWFRNAALQVRTVDVNKVMAGDRDRMVNRMTYSSIGKMFLFFYDPKGKQTLPYYDTFPLVFPIGLEAGSMLGINMHYLPPVLRAKLMDALYTITNNNKFDDTTKIKLSYQILKSAAKYRYFKPCIKRYLFPHVRSRFYNVKPTEWDTVLMLPLSRFKKATATKVYQEALEKIH